MQLKFFKLKKEKSFKKESAWFDLNLYWALAVSLVFLAILASSFFGYNLFMQINVEQKILPVTSSGQVETIKKERIDKSLEYFSVREQNSKVILNSASPVLDPSL